MINSTNSTQAAQPLSAHAITAPLAKTKNKSLVKAYYELTKPGITQMVALSTLAAFYLAIHGDVFVYASDKSNWLHFIVTIVGTVLISAGSCVFNHILERSNDARMKRTADRPIPSGVITLRQAIVFGVLLSIAGAGLLAFVNVLTLILAVATWILYVAVYTPLKVRSKWALIIGSFPGALPFIGGWTAVRGTIDTPALVLFAILFAWQIPHFLALSWMYRNDYREGGFVLRSLTDSTGKVVAWQTLISTLVTAVFCLMPWVVNMTGNMYAVGALLLCGWMCFEAVRFVRERSHAQARKVLLTSYAVLMGVYILIMADKV